MQPPLHPGAKQPVGPDDLAPIFPMNLVEQEMSTERWIDIPEGLLEKNCSGGHALCIERVLLKRPWIPLLRFTIKMKVFHRREQ